MFRLTCFELDKIWRKPSFLISLAALLVVNVFLLWYTNLPDQDTPPLSSYQKICSDMENLTEPEKEKFIEWLKRDVEGAAMVSEILSYRNFQDKEMGRAMEKKAREENPQVFEQYYDAFTSGKYLRYTESLEQELALIKEIYQESQQVFHYDKYLKSIEEKKDTLQGISVFSGGDQSSFSSRNVEKEAADYAGLSSVKLKFYPSKAVKSASSNGITDLLLLLSVFLFATALIYEEKEKRLLFITRATPLGRTKSIGAKLGALAIHSFAMVTSFYMINLLFFQCTVGLGSLFRSIQSVGAYMESSLQITVISYLALGLLTKAAVLFSLGAFLVLTAVKGKQSFMPYFAGVTVLAVSALLYLLVPASATANWLKYLNPIGLLKTENLYGSYLNLNLFGHPVSRLLMSWLMLLFYGICWSLLAIRAFLRNRSQEIKRVPMPKILHFHPHGNLYRHEGYKILIMNRGLVVLLVFALLLGYQHLSKSYIPAPAETYYQNMMMELSGELTTEKTSLIEKEEARYERAFSELDRIDGMVAKGQISEDDGENMKTPYYSETAFYPAFHRILQQFDYVKESGGKFVYDTGYLLFFGLADNNRLQDFILLTACIIFAFSAVFSMEYRDKSWNLLGATIKGKRKIYRSKILLCIGTLLPLFLLEQIFTVGAIAKSYPMEQLFASTMAIPMYREIGMDVPLIVLILMMVLMQFIVMVCVLMVTLFLSDRLKNHLQALFTSTLLLIVPPVLAAMGLTFAKWCCLFPLYDMTRQMTANHGLGISLGYGAAAIALGLLGAGLLRRRDVETR